MRGRFVALASATALGLTACGSGGGTPAKQESPSPSPSPTRPAFVALSGKLSTPFIVRKRHADCEDLRIESVITDPGEGTVEAISKSLEFATALDAVEMVEGRTIVVRGPEGESVASVETEGTAELAFVEAKGQFNRCLAITAFSVQLPTKDMYLFSVTGIQGAPEPVTYEELEERDFTCYLHIHTDGILLEEEPCLGGGWVEAAT